jgi:hypothetical protein
VSKFLKKVVGVFKAVFPYIKAILPFISVATLLAIAAWVGRFIEAVSCFLQSDVKVSVYVIILVLPFLIYAVIILIYRIIGLAKKPPYFNFTGMEYVGVNDKEYKLKWRYETIKKAVKIRNLRPVCPKCGGDLTPMLNSFLSCFNCRGYSCERLTDTDYIAAENKIWHMIETKAYLEVKNKIPKNNP